VARIDPHGGARRRNRVDRRTARASGTRSGDVFERAEDAQRAVGLATRERTERPVELALEPLTARNLCAQRLQLGRSVLWVASARTGAGERAGHESRAADACPLAHERQLSPPRACVNASHAWQVALPSSVCPEQRYHAPEYA
jgi:hypothetical protein